MSPKNLNRFISFGGIATASLSLALVCHAATLSPEQVTVGLSETDSQYDLTPFKNRFTDDCLSNSEGNEKISSLKCPAEEVFEKLKKDPQPGLQVLALSLIKNKIIQEREEFRKKAMASEDQKKSSSNFSLWNSFFLKTLPTSTLPDLEKLEADFSKKIQPYVDAAEKIYNLEEPLLGYEKKYYWAQILGESFHFNQFLDFAKSGSGDDLKHDLMAWGAAWYEKFLSSRAILRPWLLEKSTSLRSPLPKDATSDRDLFYWLLSLELQSPEDLQKNKKDVLLQLRSLWINYPQNESAQKIRNTAEVLGLNRDFSPPGINQMDFSETLIRAQALLKKMDYEGAQKALRRVWSFDSKLYTGSQAFEAYQLHIKILRFADQRHKIADVVEKYLNWAPHIFNPKSPNKELLEQIPRGIEVAKTYWTYVDGDSALSRIQELIDICKRLSNSAPLPQLYYIRARIMEQKGNREAALGFFEEALKTGLPQDMKVDLIWRYFYLHFEKATPSATLPQLFSILDRIKKELPGQDDARVFYWQGKVFTLALSHGKNKEAAIKQFLRAYEADPFSFYSNLAGMELLNLGVTPPQWFNEKTDSKLLAPIWANYINSHGEARAKEFNSLARLYHLAKIGDKTLAIKAFSEADKSVWSYLLSSKNSQSNKSQFGQAMAWLRFSLGDAMGGLRVAEVLRNGVKGKLSDHDQLLLYPLPFFEKIKARGEEYDTNPWLAASLIRQESAFNPRAKSFANAIGLMQMIPPVAAEEAKKLKISDFKPDMLYTPDFALKLGVHHLGSLIKSFDGSWICAVASYNAGQPPVKKWVQYYSSSHPVIFIERISYSETRNYVKSILRNYINYQRIYGNGVIQTSKLFDLPGEENTPKKEESENKGSSQAIQENRSSAAL